MIVFSAIVPHSPLLVPTIGKEHADKLAKTRDAYATIEKSLYLAKPDTLLVISPHTAMYPDAFSGNIHDTFTGVLKEFGDHATTVRAGVDFLVLDHIHRAFREESIPFTLTSQEELDYGFTIPLLFLTPHLQQWKLIPLAASLLDAHAHFRMGQELHNVLQNENRRIALIASADLCHHTDRNQHLPIEGAKELDDAILKAIEEGGEKAMLNISSETLERINPCGYRPITMVMGALSPVNGRMKRLSYESPFDVGYACHVFEWP